MSSSNRSYHCQQQQSDGSEDDDHAAKRSNHMANMPLLVPRPFPFGAPVTSKSVTIANIVTVVWSLTTNLPHPENEPSQNVSGGDYNNNDGAANDEEGAGEEITSPLHAKSSMSLSPPLNDLQSSTTSNNVMGVGLQPRSSSSNNINQQHNHHHRSLSNSSRPQLRRNNNNSNNNQQSSNIMHPPALPPLQQNTHTLNNNNMNSNYNKNNGAFTPPDQMVHYSSWIFWSWHLLSWAEPLSSIFWEMTTMFHSLYVASRNDSPSLNSSSAATSGGGHQNVHVNMTHGTCTSAGHAGLPPILPCGSNLSEKSFSSDRGGSVLSYATSTKGLHNNADGIFRSSGGGGSSMSSAPSSMPKTKGQRNSSISAKELPLWLIALNLCMYVAEYDSEFGINSFNNSDTNADNEKISNHNQSQKMNKKMLNENNETLVGGTQQRSLMHQIQMRIMSQSASTGVNNSGSSIDYMPFILNNLRLILVLIANPHDAQVLDALGELFEAGVNQSPRHHPFHDQSFYPSHLSDFGKHIRLSSNEIERLNFILQKPQGGGIEDVPLSIATLLIPGHEQDITEKTSILTIESELRRCLEVSLDRRVSNNLENSKYISNATKSQSNIIEEMSGLNLNDNKQKVPTSPGRKSSYSLESSASDWGSSTFVKKSSEYKLLQYANCNRTTIILRSDEDGEIGNDSDHSKVYASPRSPHASSHHFRLHDLSIICCSDMHIYLLQPFEHVSISNCHNCTIVIGPVGGLLHIAQCHQVNVTSASRRILVKDCHEVRNFCFTPSPPLLVGDTRLCQFAPYNSYYDGLREDLLSTGLASLPTHHFIVDTDLQRSSNLQVLCAKNKWKTPIDISLVESPISPLTANLTNSRSENVNEDSMQTPKILPASEFNPIFVPIEANDFGTNYEDKIEVEEGSGSNDNRSDFSASSDENTNVPKMGSLYSRAVNDMLQFSPFKLPSEYERRIEASIDRVRKVQLSMATKDLSTEQRLKIEQDLNRSFREWLISSGNLRQLLDLTHLASKNVR